MFVFTTTYWIINVHARFWLLVIEIEKKTLKVLQKENLLMYA